MLFAALPGGVFGDYCLGNYCTQALNTVVATASLWLLLLSSWQFSVTKPSCCAHTFNTFAAVSLLNGSMGSDVSLVVPGVGGAHDHYEGVAVSLLIIIIINYAYYI